MAKPSSGHSPCRSPHCFSHSLQQTEGAALTLALLGFSFCAGGALLSRVTFGAPFVLIAPILALGILGKRITNLTPLLLPLGAAITFYLWLSYARFGNLTGVNYDYYINPLDTSLSTNLACSVRADPVQFRRLFQSAFAILSARAALPVGGSPFL